MVAKARVGFSSMDFDAHIQKLNQVPYSPSPPLYPRIDPTERLLSPNSSLLQERIGYPSTLLFFYRGESREFLETINQFGGAASCLRYYAYRKMIAVKCCLLDFFLGAKKTNLGCRCTIVPPPRLRDSDFGPLDINPRPSKQTRLL